MGRHAPAAALAVLAFAALVPAGALGKTRIAVVGGKASQYQRWVDAAAVPTPGGVVTVRLEGCPAGPVQAAGCAYTDARTIYLRPEGRFRDRFLHELGHIYDASAMTDRRRARFERLLHRRGAMAWAASTPNGPSEQFAEAYSMCARHPALRAMAYGMYAYSPSPARHERICALIRQAGA